MGLSFAVVVVKRLTINPTGRKRVIYTYLTEERSFVYDLVQAVEDGDRVVAALATVLSLHEGLQS